MARKIILFEIGDLVKLKKEDTVGIKYYEIMSVRNSSFDSGFGAWCAEQVKLLKELVIDKTYTVIKDQRIDQNRVEIRVDKETTVLVNTDCLELINY